MELRGASCSIASNIFMNEEKKIKIHDRKYSLFIVSRIQINANNNDHMKIHYLGNIWSAFAIAFAVQAKNEVNI